MDHEDFGPDPDFEDDLGDHLARCCSRWCPFCEEERWRKREERWQKRTVQKIRFQVRKKWPREKPDQ